MGCKTVMLTGDNQAIVASVANEIGLTGYKASDIVLMKDDLRGISLAKRIAKKTMAIVLENIWFSLIVKLAILVLSAFGIANMWIAVFGDVGVAVLAILNAMRVNSKYAKEK